MPEHTQPHPPDAPLSRPAAPVGSPDWRTMHLWQIQPLRDVAVLGAIFGVLYLGYVLRTVTVPMLVALLLAYLFEPLVKWLTRSGVISRPGAAIGIVAGLLLVVGVPVATGLAWGVLQGVGSAQQFTANVDNFVKSVENPADERLAQQLPSEVWRTARQRVIALRQEVERQHPAPDPNAGVQAAPALPLPSATDAPSPAALQAYRVVQTSLDWLKSNAGSISKQAVEAGRDVLGVVIGAITSTGMFMFKLFLTVFFFYFFCTGYGRVRVFWEGLIPERRKGRIIDLIEQMDAVIAGFVRGRLTISAIFVLYFTLGYWLIGAPAPLALGPIVGALCLVPYAATVGMVMVVVLMLLQPAQGAWMGTWWWALLGPALVHGLNQILDDYVLSPRIQGEHTGMNTPTILFASLAGGILAGFYGLLLAIPVAACLKILLQQVVWPQVKAWAEGKSKDPLPI